MLAQVTEIDTVAGRVAGRTRPAWPGGPSVLSCLGIPYAAPPVGSLRLRPPQPAVPWAGTRRAFDFGPAPIQPGQDPLETGLPGLAPAACAEDCLTVNVWTPGAGRRLPVMVWVYGGGYSTGGSGLATYDGGRLAAEQDVVVVSFNYRLGALGFLYVDKDAGGQEVAPNCGLADQVMALTWVRENIGAFGGDPDRVTVFGESAGAGSILHLLAAPAAAGLFRRAILQSPGVTQRRGPEEAAAVGRCLLSHLGVRSAGALREIPAERVLGAQSATAAEMARQVGTMPFHPVVGTELLPQAPLEAMAAGATGQVEVVMGTTTDEMRLFAGPQLAGLDDRQILKATAMLIGAAAGRRVGEDAVAGLLEAYRGWLGPAAPARDLWAAVGTDGLMRLPAEQALAHQTRHQQNVYGYAFAWQPGGAARDMGAFHAIDLPFTFGTLDREGWDRFLGADDQAHKLSSLVRSSWAAFARHGSPDGWPRWEPGRRRTLVLDGEPTVAEDPLAERRRTWQQLG